jgi:uncharacterized membrane protein YfhO
MRACHDLGHEAWIETPGPPTNAANGSGIVTARAEGSRLVLHVVMHAPGWVVVSETAWKGWRATMNGKPLKVHFADHAFLGLYVPVGDHEIGLSYRPSSVTTGAIISLSTTVLLALLMLAPRRRFRVA